MFILLTSPYRHFRWLLKEGFKWLVASVASFVISLPQNTGLEIVSEVGIIFNPFLELSLFSARCSSPWYVKALHPAAETRAAALCEQVR